MNVIAMSNGKVESQGTDSSVETTAVQMNGSDKLDQILSIVKDIQVILTGPKSDVTGLKSDVTGLKSDVTGLKSDVTGLKSDVTGLKSDMIEVKAEISKMNTRLTSIEGSVKAIGLKLDGFRD